MKTMQVRNIPEELQRQFKSKCVRINKDYGQGLAEAMRLWIRKPIRKIQK